MALNEQIISFTAILWPPDAKSRLFGKKKKNNAGETEGKGEETDRGGGGWMA